MKTTEQITKLELHKLFEQKTGNNYNEYPANYGDFCYTQAQNDMLGESSEGFEEWNDRTLGRNTTLCEHKAWELSRFKSGDGLALKEFANKVWQASRLSMMKKIESHESQMEGLESERCHSIGLIEKLQKENEELRVKLKLLEMNQHFMEKEIKEGGK